MNIVFTIGDCSGIGLEVFVKAVIEFDKKSKFSKDTNFFITGNEKTIAEYLSYFNFPASVKNDELTIKQRTIPIIKSGSYVKVKFGEDSKNAGQLAAKSIEKAMSLTLKKRFDALVTLPVSKSSLYQAGWHYPGHTEFLAARCNIKNPLMVLCTDKVRVGLVTVHIPVKDVSKILTKSQIIENGKKFSESLTKDFGIKEPKIAVLGLNPHAGENGDIGKDEITTIIPAINELRNIDLKAFGPFPADGFFGHGEYKKYDGILAIYHDQGLIPLKLLAKGSGVNFTAGLPIVRTSPDHGTACDIAGKDVADFKSTYNAIELAIKIALSRST